MKTILRKFGLMQIPTATAAAMALFLISSLALRAQEAPAGYYAVTVDDPTNAVWNIENVGDLNEGFSIELEDEWSWVTVTIPISLRQSGAGKLTGSGQSNLRLRVEGDMYEDVSFPAAYKANGTITSSRGTTKLKLAVSATGQATFQGAVRRLSFSQNGTYTINNSALTVSGNTKTKATASGLGGLSSGEAWGPEPLGTEMGNGRWTLELLEVATTGKQVTGSARVVLQFGDEYPFSIKGSYNAKSGQSKLLLMGTDAAKGANLTVTIGPAGTITAIKGKLLGGAINYVAHNP